MQPALKTKSGVVIDFTNCLPAEASEVLALARTIANEYHEAADTIMWRDIFCHDCGTNTCQLGTALELARTAYADGWAMDFKNPTCSICADAEPPVNDDDVRADLAYDEWKDA